MQYLGESAALGTALCWVGSSLAFAESSRRAGAEATNQFRLYAALPMLLGLGWLVAGRAWPVEAGWWRVALLGLSGLVGLVIGDIGFFHALATIGPRLASVVMALWPVCTVAIDAALGAAPSAVELAGIAATVVGVTLVLLQRQDRSWRPELTARQWLGGVLGGLVGALGQAAGFVLAGYAMRPGEDLGDGVPPVLATVVRMAFAVLGMQLVVTARRRAWTMSRVARDGRATAAALCGALLGPVCGVWLSMVARRHAADAGVAAALMATTPIWMLPVAVLWHGARPGLIAMLGTLLAVGGVATCLLG
ncbi:MAG: DMT family transporter [Planctomycetes bacterium]|nr:DMT family transporter [Planctomycetota bacterium]